VQIVDVTPGCAPEERVEINGGSLANDDEFRVDARLEQRVLLIAANADDDGGW
jgi:hypothetical protein